MNIFEHQAEISKKNKELLLVLTHFLVENTLARWMLRKGYELFDFTRKEIEKYFA